jgi:hypothetical protein
MFGVHAVCCLCLLVVGCKKKEPRQAPASRLAAVAPVSDTPAVLAELRAAEGAAGGSSSGSPGAQPPADFVFAERGGGVAWMAEEGGRFRVFHNGRPGAPYAAVASVIVSPDGRRWAHAAAVDGRWVMVADGKEGPPFDEIEAPVFSQDGAHLAYRARSGERWHVVVNGKRNAGIRNRYLWHEFGGDPPRILFLEAAGGEERGNLVVSDLSFERQTVVDPGVSEVVLSTDRSRAAAVAVAGDQQRVLTFSVNTPEVVESGPPHEMTYNLRFGPHGGSLAYLARRSGGFLVVLDDREEALPQGDEALGLPVVRPGQGVAAPVISRGAVQLRQFFAKGEPEAAYAAIEGLVVSGDGRSHAYAAQKEEKWFVVVNGSEGPAFDRVVTPAFSPDGKHVVYRARKDGKRFVVVADTDGRTITQSPAYEQVFPVRFTTDGKSVAYGVKDGRQLAWKVEPL